MSRADRSIFVTYITIYKGNKLPPFYIGYTSYQKIVDGYNGTVSSKKYKNIWNSERKLNPHLFKTIILKQFETAKQACEYEEYLLRFFSAHKNPMYINLSISGKSYNITGEQRKENGIKISNSLSGKKFSIDHRKKLSLSHLGKEPWNKGKTGIYTEETRNKISIAAKSRIISDSTRQKLSNAAKNQWIKQKEH